MCIRDRVSYDLKIGLIDVDSHNFPNLCLMKLSAYHKAKGHTAVSYTHLDVYKRQYQNSRKRLSNCPRIPREEVRKYGSFQSGAKYGIYQMCIRDRSWYDLSKSFCAVWIISFSEFIA